MNTFSKIFQSTHDIDWFAKSGNIYIHAMSFGGLLPVSVNNRSRNDNILRRVYKSLTVKQELELIWNEQYLKNRIGRLSESEEDYQRRRKRYLIHFNEMARRGFYSFDRDLNDERIYHLIVRPKNFLLSNWYGGVMPEIPVGNLRWEGDEVCMMRVEIPAL